jgi:hypothetical protein
MLQLEPRPTVKKVFMMACSPWPCLRGLVAAMGFLGLAICPALAQERLEATYRATLAGLTIGTGKLSLELSRNRFTISAGGKTEGLMRMLGGGEGEAAAQGAIGGKKLISSAYQHTIRSKKLQRVRMALAAGGVKQVEVEPPIEPEADRVPLTDAHKHGIVDPASAGIIPAAGADGVGPEVCARKLPIFDGRMRYDLALSYRRQEKVRIDGYEGPAVVCRVAFEPVAGHQNNKSAIKFLRNNRDIEIWFAPIGRSPFLTFIRISLPTPLGQGVLQATRFATSGTPARTGPLDARVQ